MSDNESRYSSNEYSSSECSSSRLSSDIDDNKYNLHNLQGDILDKYNIIEEIGRGGYSIVWLGFNINDKSFYAIKVQNSNDYEEGMDEIRIMKKLNHKNVNRLKEYFIEERYDENNKLRKYICSIYDLCCGNLDGLARKGKYKNGYPEHIVKQIYQQTLDALNYLHNKLKVFHGDIKPDNILLSGINNRDKKIIDYYISQNFNDRYSEVKKQYWIEKGGKLNKIKKMNPEIKLKIRKSLHKKIIEDMYDLKINDSDKYLFDEKYIMNPHIIVTDFGNYCPDDEKFNESFGTKYYQAPEIVLQGDCTKKVDIWALGCTLYEFLKGEILFDPQSNDEQDTDMNHLDMITSYCGLYPKSYLEKCKRKNKYFNKSGKLLSRLTSEINTIENHLNEKLGDIPNKKYWINTISMMLRLTPRERVTVEELIIKEKEDLY
jgi:serine/threonine-protein kinase SRPK3